MELDDWKTAWAAHTATLERSLAINERLLRETMLRKTRFAMAPYVVWRVVEVVFGVALLALCAPVVLAHVGEPRYLFVGGGTALVIAWITWLCGYLLVGSLRLDYDGAVLAIQRDVEHLKRAEYRALKWALLGGVIVWLPVIILVLEALSGADLLARVQLAWLIGNLAVGAVMMIIGLVLSHRYVERPNLGPHGRRIIDALSGRGLRVAARQLDELSKYHREP